MRITVTVDDVLYKTALELAGPMTKAELCREALKTYVRVQSAKRLAALGGTAAEVETVLHEHEIGASKQTHQAR